MTISSASSLPTLGLFLLLSAPLSIGCGDKSKPPKHPEPPPPVIRTVEVKVPCMPPLTDQEASSKLPDMDTWTFDEATGNARDVPVSEVAKILGLVSYFGLALASCNAVVKPSH